MEGQTINDASGVDRASRLVKTLTRADHRRSHSLAPPFSNSNPHTPNSSNPNSRSSPDTGTAPVLGHEGPIKATHSHSSRNHNRSQSLSHIEVNLQPNSPPLTESDVKDAERFSMDSDSMEGFDDALSRGSKKRKGSSSTLGTASEFEDELARPSAHDPVSKSRQAKHRRAASYQLPRNNSPGQFHSISEASPSVTGSQPIQTAPVRLGASSSRQDTDKPGQHAATEAKKAAQPAPASHADEPAQAQSYRVLPPHKQVPVSLQLPGNRRQSPPIRAGRHSRNLSAPVLPVNRIMNGSPITQISSQFAQTSFTSSPGNRTGSANSNLSPMSIPTPNSGSSQPQIQQAAPPPQQPQHVQTVMPGFLDPFSVFSMQQAQMMLMSQLHRQQVMQQLQQQHQQQQPPPPPQQPQQQPQQPNVPGTLPVNIMPLVYQSLETQARNLGLGPQEARQSALNVLAQVQPQLGGMGPLGMPIPHSSLGAHRPGPVQTKQPLSQTPQTSPKPVTPVTPILTNQDDPSEANSNMAESSVPKEAKLLLNLARNASKQDNSPSLLATHATPSTVKRAPASKASKSGAATVAKEPRSITPDSQPDADGKRFKCDECGKRFHQSSNLITHRRIHTGERPYECAQCHKRFSQSSNLRRHMMTHTGEKPFECEICHKKCSRKGSLITHMRIHTGEKPFACRECGKRFSIRGSLTMHSRIHTGERPFQCNDCGKSFPRRSELTRHTKAHERQRRRDGSSDAKQKQSKQSSSGLRLPGVDQALATLRLGAQSESEK